MSIYPTDYLYLLSLILDISLSISQKIISVRSLLLLLLLLIPDEIESYLFLVATSYT